MLHVKMLPIAPDIQTILGKWSHFNFLNSGTGDIAVHWITF